MSAQLQASLDGAQELVRILTDRVSCSRRLEKQPWALGPRLCLFFLALVLASPGQHAWRSVSRATLGVQATGPSWSMSTQARFPPYKRSTPKDMQF